MEERNVRRVKIDEKKAELKELEYNSPIAKKKREIAELERQDREEIARKIGKELEKVEKQAAKASKKVEKFTKKRVDLIKEGNKWSKDKQRAWGMVQSLVAKATGLRAQLKELEMVGVRESKGMTRTEAYEQSVKNLRRGPKGDEPKSNITEEDEEPVTVHFNRRVKQK